MSSPQAASTNDDTSHHGDELKFFPILPHGLKPDFDISDWTAEVPSSFDGHVRIIYDRETRCHVVEAISRVNYRKVTLSFPNEMKYLGTPLPYLVLHVKNLGRHTAFSLEAKDEENTIRVLRVTTARSTAALEGSVMTLPLKMRPGWNKLVLNVAQMLEEAYQVPYKCAMRFTIHANCRVRRIFFCDQIYRDDELPDELRVFHSGFKSKSPHDTDYAETNRSGGSGWTKDDTM